MKKRILKKLVFLVAVMAGWAGLAGTPTYLFPPVPPTPQVQLGWTASPDLRVTNYYMYYGVGSLQYTNKVAVGNVTNTAILLARGATFYFAVTANGNGMEAPFSNEVTYTTEAGIAPVTVKPPVTLVVQNRGTEAKAQWVDTGFKVNLNPDAPSQVFRLMVLNGQEPAQVKALKALRAALQKG